LIAGLLVASFDVTSAFMTCFAVLSIVPAVLGREKER